MKPEEVFKRHNPVKGLFDRAMKDMCKEAHIKGNWIKDYVTYHRLCASMIQFSVEAGHPDCIIVLRTGHTNTTTLARRHNLRGSEYLQEQINIIGGESTTAHVVQSSVKASVLEESV